MHFGERMRELRAEAGYVSVPVFANAYNLWREERGLAPVPRYTLNGWERWGNCPVEHIGPLLDFLGVVEPADRLAVIESRQARPDSKPYTPKGVGHA
jgi:hypothetical protein